MLIQPQRYSFTYCHFANSLPEASSYHLERVVIQHSGLFVSPHSLGNFILCLNLSFKFGFKTTLGLKRK